ncbi:MAG: ferrochelatase [Pseudomonadota bacterium]
MAYRTEPHFTHGTPSKTAVLVVNLGTPEAPTAQALRPYLKQFLSDPRVVEIPRLVWWPILNGIILNTRPAKSAAKYASVWMPEGSPLKVYTERQARLLQGYLGERVPGVPLVVEYAMRYGQPSIESVLDRLRAQNCQRILVLPLYPQYSASTTATVFDELFAILQRTRHVPEVRLIKHFHKDPGYIRASAQNIRDHWTLHGRPDKLVMSFHGLPRKSLGQGDPYFCECQASARLIAQELGLTAEQYVVSFQSRFGRAEWLQPYTTSVLQELGKQKTGRVDVVCPGFAADCLETLEEIAQEGKEDFQHAGGGEYHYIPCLNERPDWINALTDLALNHLHGWLETEKPVDLEQSRLRALAAGARS